MSKPRVFVVQEVLKRDEATGNLVPLHDLTIAGAYGKIEFLLPGGKLPLIPKPTIWDLEKKLSDFSDQDYLVLVGDPVAMGIVTALAAKSNHGRVKFLKWNRNSGDYVEVQVEL